MKELYEASFSTLNIIPTIFLCFSILYWIIVVIGAIDMDFLDVDLDVDTDVDIDVDADIDADIDVDADVDAGTDISGDAVSVGWFNATLKFFNLGTVPFMIIFSVFSLSLWAMSVLINHYFFITSFAISALFLVPEFIACLFITKFITLPLAVMFRKMRCNPDELTSAKGMVCKVLMQTEGNKLGQAEINKDGNVLRINIYAAKGHVLKKGDTALVIFHDSQKNTYTVEPYNQ